MDILKTLQDIEEIKKLQYLYAHYCNLGVNGKTMDYDKVPGLFIEQGTWDVPELGISCKGRKEISETFKQLGESTGYYVHGFINPIIDVDGDTATGNWDLYLGTVAEGKPAFMIGCYDFVYVRQPEGWRIKSVVVYVGKTVVSVV